MKIEPDASLIKAHFHEQLGQQPKRDLKKNKLKPDYNVPAVDLQ